MLPSFVVTGFLGSGKTTFLINSVRRHFEGRRVAIVVNELGEVGVDGKILQGIYSDVMEIAEGCICCSLHAEFQKALSEIKEKFNPEILFVETSGAAEPFPVMLSLQSLGCSVEGVACIVDSKNFLEYKDDPVAKHQIGSSNILILNKIDLVSQDQLKQVEDEVLNVWRQNQLRNYFTGEPLFRSPPRIYRASHGVVPKEVFEGVYPLEELTAIPHHHDHDHSHQRKDIVYIEEEIDYEKLMEILEDLTKKAIRVKGIVRVKDSPYPLIVNYSFGLLDISELNHYSGPSFLITINSGT
ncbi:CobW family GTP-binding protein [Thermocrinis minervae]|uniref:GTPase, G3E family n=1 Tax=Thermocrinis minervae TaxID=381751 RepID=A0A1M6SBT9_9AQUI|nr:CobW family GTP-binding protein [Thermocrinis minervae]SHK41997.1 GTPase, G3E family [Thermocrinis minervae]